MKRFSQNNRGSILLIAILVLYMMVALAVSFTGANLSEISNTRRYYHSAAAFWLAEAGINMYMHDPTILNDNGTKHVLYGDGEILISKDDSKSMLRLVTATGTYGGLKRSIQISYPSMVPQAYQNVISTRGDILVNGSKTSAIINGQARISGTIGGTSANADVYFENFSEREPRSLTGLDAKDFIRSTRELVAGYPSEQVLYLKGNGTVILAPGDVVGKTIVYVEGAGVVINSNALVQPGQTLTVISTGNVTFNQNGFQPANSNLNIIGWEGYTESVAAASRHRGLIYTHGRAIFDNIKDSSTTTGGVIAEGGVVLGNIWSTKTFNYADMARGGICPPGFEALRGKGRLQVASKPISWKEVAN
jgi:hypothetical protein